MNMIPNGNAPQDDDPKGPPSGNDEMNFSDLSPEDQQQVLKFVMQGKPQTPQNLNQAKNLLENDPETVEAICDKLGIQCGPADNDDSDDQQEDDDNGK